MTTSRPDRHDEPRDPRVDAAWRAASREEPPAAIDDAIRAAARREAGAGPRRAAEDVPEATSPERWWWPLAAAATIGAVALGILQIVGTSPTETHRPDRAVVSDVPNVSAERSAVRPETAPRVDSARPAEPRTQPSPAQAGRASDVAPPATAKRTEPSAVPQTIVAPTPPAPGKPAPPSPSPVETVPAGGTVAVDRPAPEAMPARRAPAPFPAAPAASEPQGASPPGADATTEATSRARRDEAPAAAQGAMRIASPASAKATTALQSERGVPTEARPRLPVAEWVALIRRLRDEGRIDDAAKELAAFRAAYADHERQLPPDLRDWKPPQAR
jgi:hypothetical protein